LKKSIDRNFVYYSIKLLDLYDYDLTGLNKPSNKSKRIIELLSSENKNQQLEGITSFGYEVNQNKKSSLYELIELDALTPLININRTYRGSYLSQVAILFITKICDTNYGKKKILESRLIKKIVMQLKSCKGDVYNLHLLQLCEIFCLYMKTTKIFIEEKGHEVIVEIILKFYSNPLAYDICFNAIKVLKNLCVIYKENINEISKSFENLFEIKNKNVDEISKLIKIGSIGITGFEEYKLKRFKDVYQSLTDQTIIKKTLDDEISFIYKNIKNN
jgi:hypothetical protein